MPIDTQEVVDQLEQAGVPAQQAKAHAAVLANALDAQAQELKDHCCSKLDLARAVAPLASKEDIAEVKAQFRQGLSDLKHDVSQRLAELREEFYRALNEHGERLEARIAANIRGDFIKWGFGLLFAQTGLIALVIQLFDVL